MCEDNGIKFIGASNKSIDLLGSKTEAKALAIKIMFPLSPEQTSRFRILIRSNR